MRRTGRAPSRPAARRTGAGQWLTGVGMPSLGVGGCCSSGWEQPAGGHGLSVSPVGSGAAVGVGGHSSVTSPGAVGQPSDGVGFGVGVALGVGVAFVFGAALLERSVVGSGGGGGLDVLGTAGTRLSLFDGGREVADMSGAVDWVKFTSPL